ncbi:MAG: succinate dehydrogenase cytochrome b subunit [Deltaproteobacteria bacterium]|jgi:succinate dehydrogenase / fumarate reductase cytochrome b subunit|nr:succinate dehydrogenase cytochrome b subunit [Deltaproteobacteria bacterium]
MNWLKQTLWSSIGKKLMMAVTGLAFCGFLAGHLAGNLTIYAGKDAFNSYAEHLHSLGPLITAAEIGLVVFAIIHILTGLTLFYQNTTARSGRYAVNKKGGGRTIGSATMPYTGIILLVFVIMHLLNFTFRDKSGTTIAQIVTQTFQNPLWVIVYILAMIVAAVHVSHGFWSAFQTIGLNHARYMPLIMTLSILFSLLVGFGFGLLPIYISMTG